MLYCIPKIPVNCCEVTGIQISLPNAALPPPAINPKPVKVGFEDPPVIVIAPAVLLKGIISPSPSDTSIEVGELLNCTTAVPFTFPVKQTSKSLVPSATLRPARASSNQLKVILPGVVPLPGTPKDASVSPARPKLDTDTKSSIVLL